MTVVERCPNYIGGRFSSIVSKKMANMRIGGGRRRACTTNIAVAYARMKSIDTNVEKGSVISVGISNLDFIDD